jgi:hypothetical protein
MTFEKPLRRLFVVGLKPSGSYVIGTGRRETQEKRADPGGIVEIAFPSGFRGALRIQEPPGH